MVVIDNLQLYIVLLIFTMMIIVFGAIGYSVKRDIKYVLGFQILIACVMVIFIELVTYIAQAFLI